MTKIEEILNYYIPPICQTDSHLIMMKEYAEWYAKKCLEMLDSEAEYTDQNCYCDSWVLPDKPSNYKLIEHE